MRRRAFLLSGLVAVALLAPPPVSVTAHAGTTGVINDVDNVRTLPGNDFDPACVVPNPTPVVSGIATGTAPQYGCAYSVNDGASTATDLASIRLGSDDGYDNTDGTADDRLVATMVINGIVPLPNDPLSTFDGPYDPQSPWNGATYLVMFNNTDKQVDRPNPNAGCTAAGGSGTWDDQQRHWHDGHYKFLGITSTWTGSDWMITASAGTYDPAAWWFLYTDLEREPAMFGPNGTGEAGPNNASDDEFDYDVQQNVPAAGQTTLRIWIEGDVDHTDPRCASGVFVETFANHTPGWFSPGGYTGDRINHVFGLSSAHVLDVDAAGYVRGYLYYADNTHQAAGGDVYTPGVPGGPDNLGDSQGCAVRGGFSAVPRNPIEASGTGCQIDDDALGWPVLDEFHRSQYGFTF